MKVCLSGRWQTWGLGKGSCGGSGNRGFGAQLTVAGGRPQQNNYSNGSPGSVAGVNLGVDAIQEFSVVTANGSAEYGREAGGVINAG